MPPTFRQELQQSVFSRSRKLIFGWRAKWRRIAAGAEDARRALETAEQEPEDANPSVRRRTEDSVIPVVSSPFTDTSAQE